MFQLSQADREAINARMIYAVDLYLNEPTLNDALSKLYTTFLPDTASQQGDLMAEHILLRIQEYDATRAELLSLADSPQKLTNQIQDRLTELMEETPLYDQCQQLASILEGTKGLESALMGVHTTPKEALSGGVCPDKPYTGVVSESARNELLEEVTKQILSPTVAETLARQAAENPIPDPYPELSSVMNQDAYRALLSAAVYTVLLSGEHSLTPEGMVISIDQIIPEVCRSMGFRQAGYALAEKDISTQDCTALYNADWSTVKFLLAAGVLAGGAAVVLLTKSIVVAYVTYYTVMALFAGIAFFSDYLLDLLFQGKVVEDDDVQIDLSQVKADAAAYLMGTAAQALPEARKENTAPTKETRKLEQTEPNYLG